MYSLSGTVGLELGMLVGDDDGDADGWAVGDADGDALGRAVGLALGLALGCLVGLGVGPACDHQWKLNMKMDEGEFVRCKFKFNSNKAQNRMT